MSWVSQHWRAFEAASDCNASERAAKLKEPTKRELREQIAEAVRNTAAFPKKGKKRDR